jgi:UDP-N-acetylmuramyl pentapeptide synthase
VNIENLTAAIAVALNCGVDEEDEYESHVLSGCEKTIRYKGQSAG